MGWCKGIKRWCMCVAYKTVRRCEFGLVTAPAVCVHVWSPQRVKEREIDARSFLAVVITWAKVVQWGEKNENESEVLVIFLTYWKKWRFFFIFIAHLFYVPYVLYSSVYACTCMVRAHACVCVREREKKRDWACVRARRILCLLMQSPHPQSLLCAVPEKKKTSKRICDITFFIQYCGKCGEFIIIIIAFLSLQWTAEPVALLSSASCCPFKGFSLFFSCLNEQRFDVAFLSVAQEK